jgi:hypothetical protein
MEDKVVAADVGRPDLRAALIAARQFGVIAARQLAGCGMGRNMVSTRVADGRLRRLHRGVYAGGTTTCDRKLVFWLLSLPADTALS